MGDHNPSVIAHQAIPLALELTAADLGVRVQSDWVATGAISHAANDLAQYQGIWCVPASPYESMQGALDAIQFARERQVPFLGTCAGFQHALIEYARNVAGIKDADHAETNPGAAKLVISRLSCSLVEVQSEIVLVPGSLLHKSYGTPTITEGYHCNYGPSKESRRVVVRWKASRGGPRCSERGSRRRVARTPVLRRDFVSAGTPRAKRRSAADCAGVCTRGDARVMLD